MSPPELERLYDAHAASVQAYLLNLLRDEADARDAFQAVFQQLMGRNDVAGVRDERGFVLRLAHSRAVDALRRQAVRRRAEETAATLPGIELFAPTADPDEAEFRRQLAAALAGLPSDQRAVVHLKLWEGLTFERIAGLLEIPLHTAASRYRYGLDKLRGRLRPLYDEIRDGTSSAPGTGGG